MSLPPAWPLRARVALLALLPLLAAPSVQAAAAAAAQLDQRGHSTVPQQLCDPLQHGAKGDGTTDDTHTHTSHRRRRRRVPGWRRRAARRGQNLYQRAF